MLHITSLSEGLDLFKALGSDMRVDILNLLLENNNMNMNEMASRLNITNGALTSHIKKLENCGLITTSSESAGHGNQKICSIHFDKILIDLDKDADYENVFSTELRVGHYSSYKISPTCGLASANALVGEVDDARYFEHPDRYNADILWFTKGYVEYAIPNLIPASQKITQITLSAELSSEAPGVNENWPSDISVYLNDVCIGKWTSPGDFGDVRGIFTPDWWYPNWNQYGLLKLIVINKKGTFIDGLKISDVNIESFHLDSHSTIRFRMGVDDDAAHVGGLTIFGKTFGNYGQDIRVNIHYAPLETETK
jgi:predicted transcriptional regulator